MSTPTIPDWISAASSFLSIPIIIWGIVKIFKKDKNQERKINSLENLAISQDEMIKKMTEQINELAKQTSEYQFQSVLMKESNSLISKQIELQNDIFLHNKGIEEKKLEIQEIKRLSEIKPHFTNNGGSGSSSNFLINLKNKGFTARNLRLNKIRGEFIIFEKLNPEVEIDSGKNIEIKANITPSGRNQDNGNRDYEIELLFEDIDGNKYKQKIENRKIGNPELIKE
ncbi:hypothetical protein [Mangrovibacterium marinum]|uniref:Uncharacterized protein n=1 Tax=Mangrovibacterium marinum TaxID=1639118 RepID=A0A2T5C4D2_9BACT|nr:hypothetical protein [Mangrovibacterium marinum]PTN09718.1 hypothetical protein C8N47_1032 [Mangrovibacterium marinum]